VARFFPDASDVAAARELFSCGRYSDLSHVMRATRLPWPHTDDLPAVITEFGQLAETLGLADEDASFMVLVPVRVNGAVLTTPVLLDLERRELAFTSHPALGAGAIPNTVIAENTQLASAIREELLGVLATWHNYAAAEEGNA
jgi:hypothetical protein